MEKGKRVKRKNDKKRENEGREKMRDKRKLRDHREVKEMEMGKQRNGVTQEEENAALFTCITRKHQLPRIHGQQD